MSLDRITLFLCQHGVLFFHVYIARNVEDGHSFGPWGASFDNWSHAPQETSVFILTRDWYGRTC